MIRLESIKLQNVVAYKEQEFTFKEGVTVITGENGAGKSLVFSSIANNLYFSHPLSEKKDAKSLLNASHQGTPDYLVGSEKKQVKERKKVASIELELRSRAGQPSSIAQKSSGDSITYTIVEGGEDLECRTVAISKDHIEKLFPIPEDIFYTSIYLSSYRNHPLLHGATAQRYEFFEKLFNFDLFDHLFDKFDRDFKALDKQRVEVDSLKAIIAEGDGVAGTEEALRQAGERLVTAKEILSTLQDKAAGLTEVKFCLEKIKDARKDLDQATKVVGDVSERLTKGFPSITTEAIESIDRETYESIKSYYTAKLEAEKSEALLQSISANLTAKRLELATCQEKLSLEGYTTLEIVSLGIEIDTIKEKGSALRRSLGGKDLQAWRSAFSTAASTKQAFCDQIGKPVTYLEGLTVLDLESKRATLLSRIAKDILLVEQTAGKLEKTETLEGGQLSESIECGTCQSKLTLEQVEALQAQLRADLAKFKERVRSQKSLLKLLEACMASISALQGVASLEEVEAIIRALEEGRERATMLEDIRARLTAAVSLEQEVDKEQGRLARLEVDTSKLLVSPLVILEGLTSGALYKLLDLIKDFKAASKSAKSLEGNMLQLSDSLANRLESCNFLEGAVELSVIENSLLEAHRAVRDHSNKVIALTADARVLERRLSDLMQYQKKVDDFLPRYEELRLSQILSQTFHSKGFRMEKINQFIGIFQETVNRYAKYLFSESIEFTIQMEKRDLSIFAKRNGYTSDVRFLSGSESRRFQLLCLISILYLLPQEKRCSVCILDEMNAGMDEDKNKLFYESFIPELKQIVPSIVIITPIEPSGYYFIPDRTFDVSVDSGVSSLRERS